MKMLHLPLKAKWYEMIASGEKKEEYREIKPYWSKRFTGMFKPLFSFVATIDNPMLKDIPTLNSPTDTRSKQ